MARAEIGTAKYQSKKLKMAGLQKLKFYCQLCEKQCRDANGFKNHIASPSHQRKIQSLNDEGQGKTVVENYSEQFEKDFMRLLRINHGTKKINANKFYQEYILNDRDHVHMNSTKWSSLTSFIKYLGQRGLVRVEQGGSGNEDEFNLEIRLVDQSIEIQQNQKEKLKAENKRSDEQLTNKFLEEQIRRGKESAKLNEESQPEDVQVPVTVQSGPIKVSLKSTGITKKLQRPSKSIFGDAASDDEVEADKKPEPKETKGKIKFGSIKKH
ncbi:predicted protein [Scheffersomyces stipitis CBS 6054]|uniref:C2H2-type domain-containing protein n=1 Tax=Scheffersomyces stipitis (strain ATCC 58785 / CBS 6054 / NBRC 10063 / NRRL Y-11545) TaxID=322104 RepID=A3LYP2_PICST|nr:predicted protein [Scheffersomyces stipitis CBS 6054]ABN68008.1 predicted protein [Scheffersomyces stipitis CBS 6054]